MSDPTTEILNEVHRERARQDQRWGEQNHHDVDPVSGDVLHANAGLRAANWKRVNDYRAEAGRLDWYGVLLEEVYEALAESDPERLIEELTQVAAVAVCWIECIKRRES